MQSYQFKDKGYLEVQEDAIKDELLVKVPGSAYTSGNGMGAGSEALPESSNSRKILVLKATQWIKILYRALPMAP